ncbi:MAG: hypothetical protein AAGG44_11195 [Planctomycetota bacterium]
MSERTGETDSSDVREAGSWIYWVLVAASFIVLGSALFQYQERRRTLSEAQANLAECKKVVREIAQLKTRPRLAASNLGSSQDTSQRIASAMEAAGIRSNSLQSMSPSPVARIGLSDYRERITRLEFRGVMLSKLVAFEGQLKDGSGLTVSEFAIYAPNRAELQKLDLASKGSEFWNARLTLTELIYSPTSPQ